MSSIPLYQVDAFSDQPFRGNPAGVCLLPEAQPESWMQAVAAEMNLSETAFLVKNGADFDLRWFTPKTEVDLCGHATLASAHILFETETVATDATIRFHSLSGLLTATKQQDWIELNFPVRKITLIGEVEGATDAAGSVPDETYESAGNLLYVYKEEAIIRSMTPDFSALAKTGYHGLIVTAPASTPPFDFVSRFFAPNLGVNEDPVTGSAHCTLAPFWQEMLHKNQMLAYQCSVRGGILKVRVSAERVYISGQALTVFATALNN
jgi:predicted PhzF superfamily epimerase YddE/YHI9